MTIRQMKKPVRLVFGGSFDPPHLGHLAILNYVLKNNIAQFISMVPTAVSPFKQTAPPALYTHRIEMIRLLTDKCKFKKQINIETIETKRSGPSYTIDTLEYLNKMYRDDSLGLLVGSDSLQGFEKWKMVKQILMSFPLFIFCRTTDTNKVQNDLLTIQHLLDFDITKTCKILQNEIVDCSSTKARLQPDTSCLPNSILAYINQHQLYESSNIE